MAEPAESSITIQDITFQIDMPYQEGHQVSEVEAGVLNQARAEALRNNFAKKVKDAKTRAGNGAVSGEELATLKSEFAQYMASYTFKAKGAPRVPKDPVQREAEKIATATLHTALNNKGMKKDSLQEGRWELLIAELMAKPSVQAEAQRRVEAAKSVAADALDLG